MNAPLVTRGPLGLAAAALAGCLSVAFLLVALLHVNTGLVFLAYFAALPLYLAGLGAGALAGLIAIAVGTGLLYASEPPNFAVLYVIAYGVPAVSLIGLALRYRIGTDLKVRWYPEGRLLTAITFYPCILFLVAAAVASTHPGGLLDLTQTMFTQVGTQFAKQLPEDQATAFNSAIARAAKIAPALIGYTWIFVAIISMSGAQHILNKQKLNLRDSFSFKELQVPTWLIHTVAITGLTGAFGAEPYDYIGRNLSMILGLPFFFVGVAVMHAVAAGLKHGWVMLTAFYVTMVLLPWVALVVAALGVIDQWVNFRQRIVPKTTV